METKLRRVQLEQLGILKLIHGICMENGIKYSLYAGTLLGAVRHQGAIPWDDDLDICMLRPDYDRFIRIWQAQGPAGYILQNKENAPKFTQGFTKIRKDHTTFLQSEAEIGAYHTGIFVDIFPIDRIPEGKWAQTLFRWDCSRYQLLTREHLPEKANAVVKCVAKVLLGWVKDRPGQRQKLLRRIARHANDPGLPTIAIETFDTLNTLYPADLLDEVVPLRYEDAAFLCFKDWDLYLRRKYGDYMQPPPEKDRVWKHHPIRIDFDHNYEELGENA